MKSDVIIIAYALDPRPLVYSFWTPDVTLRLFLHSNMAGVVSACQELEANCEGTILYDYRQNRGLGRSCNEGIRDALKANSQAIIVMNDDVQLTRAEFNLFVRGCVEHPECGIVQSDGFNVDRTRQQPLGFSLFGINRLAIDRAGYFDRNLPDYFCDCDYGRRLHLAGVPVHSLGETNIYHAGSATINTVPALKRALQMSFPADNAYFIAKHGGNVGSETFTHPFDDPALDWRIDEVMWDCPYLIQQREDVGRL